MKLGTPDHVKFLRLSRRLKLSRWETVGVLESLWMLTARSAPGGNIGRLTNEDIAALIEWDADADELIAALVQAGWLDESEEHRLLVHNWEKHCPTFIKGNMSRHGKGFAKQPAMQDATAGCQEAAKQAAILHDEQELGSDREVI